MEVSRVTIPISVPITFSLLFSVDVILEDKSFHALLMVPISHPRSTSIISHAFLRAPSTLINLLHYFEVQNSGAN